MLLPPAVPNHAGLIVAAESTEATTVLPDKTRPRWVKGLKTKMHQGLEDCGLGLTFKGARYARCYMCMTPDTIESMQIDHIRSWSEIKSALKEAATTDKGRSAYDSKLKFFYQATKGKETYKAEDPYSATLWAGVYFSNDLDNLLFIHGGGCNQSKGNREVKTAFQTNVYSKYGNLSHAFTKNGYLEIMEKSQTSLNPLKTILTGIKESIVITAQLEMMNEIWNKQMESQLELESEQSGKLQAMTPSDQSFKWQNPKLLPSKKEASFNQKSSMKRGNLVQNPMQRLQPFSDDSFDMSLSSNMTRKLKQLRPPNGFPLDLIKESPLKKNKSDGPGFVANRDK
jgi:hypothetical protein